MSAAPSLAASPTPSPALTLFVKRDTALDDLEGFFGSEKL